MKWLTVLKSECKRLIGLRSFYVYMAIMAAAAVYGIYYDLDIISPGKDTVTMASALLGSAKTSAVIGSIAFAIFTLTEMNRDAKTRTGLIVSTYTDCFQIYIPRILSVILAGFMGAVASLLMCFAFQFKNTVNSGFPLLLFSFLLITFAAIIFTVLICAGLYLIFERIELSMVLYIGLVYMSLNSEKNYLLNWVQTNITWYSDNFGNAADMKLILWNRLLWLLVSLAIFIFGLQFTRRYGYGLFKSFVWNFKKKILPLALCALLPLSSAAYAFEPLFTDGLSEQELEIQQYVQKSKHNKVKSIYDTLCSKIQDDERYMKVVKTILTLSIDPQAGSLKGETDLTVEKTKTGAGYLCFKLQKGLRLEKVISDGQETQWQALSEDVYAVKMADKTQTQYQIYYSGIPANFGYLDQGSPDYTISERYINLADEACMAVPCQYIIDDTAYERFEESEMEFESFLSLPEKFVLATTGETVKSDIAINGYIKWSSVSTMSKLPHITINASPDYTVSKTKINGITLETYYSDNTNIESVNPGEILTSAMKYFTEWFGQSALNFSTLKLVERHVNEDAVVAESNVIFIDESIFTQTNLEYTDEQKAMEIDKLVKQACGIWWTEFIITFTEKPKDSEGGGVKLSDYFKNNTWGSRQFIEYCTYQYILDTYGDDFAKIIENEWKKNTLNFMNNFYYQNPEYLGIVPENYIDEVINDINEARFWNYVPLKMLFYARKTGQSIMKNNIGKVTQEFIKTKRADLIMETLSFTTEFEIEKGELVNE